MNREGEIDLQRSPEEIARDYEKRAMAAQQSVAERYTDNNNIDLSRLPPDRPTPIFAIRTKVISHLVNPDD